MTLDSFRKVPRSDTLPSPVFRASFVSGTINLRGENGEGLLTSTYELKPGDTFLTKSERVEFVDDAGLVLRIGPNSEAAFVFDEDIGM